MENRYFTELARRLGSDGVKTSATDGNRLEVLLRSRPVLCVSKNGNVIMLPDGRDNPEAGDLYHQTDALAGEVYEYVHAVENAPLLHAVDLRDKFHLLADFGGAVLAGRRREDGHGYQFVTWIWGYDRTGVNHGHYTIDVFLLEKEIGEILDEERDSLTSLNAMCGAIAKLDEQAQNKLEAVIVFANPEDAAQIRQLAENLDQFDFVPGVHSPEEYGKYMIRESGRFEYDDNLDGFYDYRGYGERRIQRENGRFSAYGYVAYCGTLTLDELMAEDPAEAYQAEQNLQMGGLE